jgi:hypothetical protein
VFQHDSARRALRCQLRTTWGGQCPESFCWPKRVLWIKWNSVSELGKSLAYVEMVGKSFGLPVPDVAFICFVLFVRR